MKRVALALASAVAVALPVFADDAPKIASAGGDITEILFELGVGNQVVATDTTSIYPKSVLDLPKIGYVRALSAEGVLSMGADLLIGADDMGPPSVMDNLEAAGMEIAYAPKGTGAERYPDKVRFVADVLDIPERGAELIADYEAEMETVAARRNGLSRAPRALLLLSVRDGAPIAAGTETTGNDIIAISGGGNVASFEGWKPMNSEAIIAAAPEIIIMSDLHLERLGGVEVIMDRPDIAATPAGEAQRYVVLNPQMMLQFGPRSPQAMIALITAFEELNGS
jgi:iron complex transport system substrate-binding protein